MTLRFAYLQQQTTAPIIPLNGRTSRPKAFITVSIIGPTDTRALEGLLDTGSDDTVFHESLAALIGIDLTTAPAGVAQGVSGAAIPVRYAEVMLRITDGIEQREWKAWVGFTPLRSSYALLGFAGFLQFFTATFHGDDEEVELTVNRNYSGT
jgi:hypothetical protein